MQLIAQQRFFLQISAASQKKSLSGLDSTQTDGADGFTSLEEATNAHSTLGFTLLSSAACKADGGNGSSMQGLHLHNWLMTRKSEILIGQNPFLSDFYPKIYDYSVDKYE